MTDFSDLFESVRRGTIENGRREFDSETFAKLFDKYREDPIQLLIDQYINGVSLLGLRETHDVKPKHKFARSILQPLHASVGLDFICLELESSLQPEIDQYSATGSENHLRQIIWREKGVLAESSLLQGRVNYGYFDILRKAKRLGIPIIAIDSHEHDINNARNEYMVSRIPTKGRGLFYCGGLHVPNVGNILKTTRDPTEIHLMNQITEESLLGENEILFSEALVAKSYSSPVAVNFRKHKDLSGLLNDVTLMEGFVRDFDSVVYHPSPEVISRILSKVRLMLGG